MCGRLRFGKMYSGCTDFALRHLHLAKLVISLASLDAFWARRDDWLSISAAMPEKGPGHPGHFLAKATAATFVGRLAIRSSRQGWFVAPFGVPDRGHRPGDEQRPQILIALFGDFAKPRLPTC